jgi:hypothetical protein
MTLVGAWTHLTTANFCFLEARQDGVAVGSEYAMYFDIAGSFYGLNYVVELIPSVGSHLFSYGFKTTTGGNAIVAAQSARPLTMVVQELVTPSANNGTS